MLQNRKSSQIQSQHQSFSLIFAHTKYLTQSVLPASCPSRLISRPTNWLLFAPKRRKKQFDWAKGKRGRLELETSCETRPVRSHFSHTFGQKIVKITQNYAKFFTILEKFAEIIQNYPKLCFKSRVFLLKTLKKCRKMSNFRHFQI